MKRIIIIAVLSCILLYVCDYLFVVLRMHTKFAGSAYATLQVEPVYAVPHKDGRAEYIFQPPVTVSCVRSLFPHFNNPPCWYASRQSQKPIPMIILPPVVQGAAWLDSFR